MLLSGFSYLIGETSAAGVQCHVSDKCFLQAAGYLAIGLHFYMNLTASMACPRQLLLAPLGLRSRRVWTQWREHGRRAPRAVSQVSSRAVTFLLNLVITRLLSPEAYGVRSAAHPGGPSHDAASTRCPCEARGSSGVTFY